MSDHKIQSWRFLMVGNRQFTKKKINVINSCEVAYIIAKNSCLCTSKFQGLNYSIQGLPHLYTIIKREVNGKWWVVSTEFVFLIYVVSINHHTSRNVYFPFAFSTKFRAIPVPEFTGNYRVCMRLSLAWNSEIIATVPSVRAIIASTIISQFT
jgi:hypothetical protein